MEQEALTMILGIIGIISHAQPRKITIFVEKPIVWSNQIEGPKVLIVRQVKKPRVWFARAGSSDRHVRKPWSCQ